MPGHAPPPTTIGDAGLGGFQPDDRDVDVMLVAELTGPECTGDIGLGDAKSGALLMEPVWLSAVSAILSLCF